MTHSATLLGQSYALWLLISYISIPDCPCIFTSFLLYWKIANQLSFFLKAYLDLNLDISPSGCCVLNNLYGILGITLSASFHFWINMSLFTLVYLLLKHQTSKLIKTLTPVQSLLSLFFFSTTILEIRTHLFYFTHTAHLILTLQLCFRYLQAQCFWLLC